MVIKPISEPMKAHLESRFPSTYWNHNHTKLNLTSVTNKREFVGMMDILGFRAGSNADFVYWKPTN